MGELHANLLAISARGGLVDPGHASMAGHGLAMVISLQAVFSFMRDDPQFYNLASYLVCAPLLLIWAIVTLRNRPSPRQAWLGLAVIAALSMLPVYHRQYDAKLLLLAVPACVLLWAEGDAVGRLALGVTAAGIFVTGDLPWVAVLGLIRWMHLPATWLMQQVVAAVQVLPVPLILLLMSVFYLWVYARQSRVKRS